MKKKSIFYMVSLSSQFLQAPTKIDLMVKSKPIFLFKNDKDERHTKKTKKPHCVADLRNVLTMTVVTTKV